ncbi:MAG: FecR domain-containing protein [Rhodocyclaceae bacterium]
MTTPLTGHADSADALRQQAWAWLRLFHSHQVKPRDAERFKRWLEQGAGQAAAFREAKAHWNALGPAAAELLRSSPQAAAFHERQRPAPRPHRRAFLGAAIGAAAMAGVAAVNVPGAWWSSPAQWDADYRTATGEQQVLALTAHVQVTLNTQTSIRRQLSGGVTTGVDLLAGEAAIDLTGGVRPSSFGVAAGVGRSVADAGRFEVRYLDGKVCVSCIEGRVRVEHPAGTRPLLAGQQTVYDRHAIGGVARIDAERVAAWRKGELVFTDMPLARVLAEIDRYRPGRIVLMNDAAGGRPVTGIFQIASLDLALAQLQHAFHLDARSLPGGLVVLT